MLEEVGDGSDPILDTAANHAPTLSTRAREAFAGLNSVHGCFRRLGNFLLQSKVSQFVARLLQTPETAQQFVRMHFAKLQLRSAPLPRMSTSEIIQITD